MALPDEQLEETKLEDSKSKETKPGFNMKILLFGVPLFIAQLVLVYFITANFLIKKFENKSGSKTASTTQVNNSSQKTSSDADFGRYIYSLDDIIVNPADTDGKRLLLTSVGIDLKSAAMQNELKTRDAIVKDAIISTLSSKTVDQLDNTNYRDSLKVEIAKRITQMIPSVSINTIYFSKYILQ